MTGSPMVGRRLILVDCEDSFGNKTQSEFEQLFSSGISTLPPLFWLVWNYQSGPFDSLAYTEYPDEWLDQLTIDIPSADRGKSFLALVLLQPEFLPKLGRYVQCDGEFLGVSCSKKEALDIGEEVARLEWGIRDEMASGAQLRWDFRRSGNSEAVEAQRERERDFGGEHKAAKRRLVESTGTLYLDFLNDAHSECWVAKERAALFFAAQENLPGCVRIEELKHSAERKAAARGSLS